MLSQRKTEAKWVEYGVRQHWKIQVQKDGVRKTFRSNVPGVKGKIDAERQADHWLEYGDDFECMTIDELFQQFLDSKRKTTSFSNYRSLENRYQVWIEPYIGRKRIRSVKLSDLQDILDSACGAGKSRKTIINLRGDISSFYKFCRKRSATHLIPELDIPRKAQSSEKKILNRRDLQTLMSVDTKTYTIHRHGTKYERVDFEPYINAFRLQVVTGLRPGEICGLQWDDITSREIIIRRSVNIYGEVTKGKNDNARRIIPLTEWAKKILDDQRNLTGHLSSVFDITTEGAYRYHLKSYCISNGITVVTPYELRHTFISSIGKQLEVGDVKEIVGHSESMDTYGIYGHQFDGDSQRVANQMDAITSAILTPEDDEYDGNNYNI